MSDYLEVAKMAANTGVSGLLIMVGWKLTDKWAGRFLAAQNGQADALSALAKAVQEGQGEQRELLLAVRVMATKQDEMKGWMRELDEHVRSAVAVKGPTNADGR
jgi:hypothetical protein